MASRKTRKEFDNSAEYQIQRRNLCSMFWPSSEILGDEEIWKESKKRDGEFDETSSLFTRKEKFGDVGDSDDWKNVNTTLVTVSTPEKEDSPSTDLITTENRSHIDGEIFHKPFVEKPLNAEDHNIYIYFPSSAGGGSQRLFRKVGDRSSKYFQISSVRTNGSYLYEEFMPTDGTDVKVYTVADDYAHAEARKSPALDGKVERDCEGKEIRYPVILTQREKIIAKKVAKVVKQQICGFDLLRANGMSYVCDVNGFSFVKTSRKYYDDCSHILGVLITRRIAPLLCPTGGLPGIDPGRDDDIPLVPTTCGTIMELRCVIAVFRHGDRTPKQKMKMEVRHERFFQLFKKYSGGRTNELKLKKPTQLQEVLDIVRSLLDDIESGKLKNSAIEEKKAKFEQLRYVLEMYGSFSGINRKIQLKYQPNGRQTETKKDKVQGSADDRKADEGSNASKAAAAAANQTEASASEPCILLVVKWGGELTQAGRQQAEQLGRAFRCIYPGGDGNYSKNPGLGLLRLHSTYRHDLKIYASDEGRVQMTAAAFAKGFLALEGELPPILVQMVKSANTNGLLDNDNDCHHYQQIVKKRIKEVMCMKNDFTDEDRAKLVPTGAKALLNAMNFVRNPHEACTKLFGYVQRLANRVAMLTANPKERSKIELYHNESWDLLLRRWGKLVKDFRSPSGDFDVSKLPDIYDNIKYDIQHNPGILIESEMLEFFSLARALADIVVPQEYGITKEEKLVISQRICTPLLRKILSDARYTDVDECTRLHAGYSKGVASPERFVRTRLYFTSESHLHSLLTCLQYGDLADVTKDEQWRRAMDYVTTVPELNYLSQVVIMIYEDPTVEPKTEKKFHVELHFSPGAHALCRDLPAGSGFRPGRREYAHSPTSLLSSCTSLAETSMDTDDTDDSQDPNPEKSQASPMQPSTLRKKPSLLDRSRSIREQHPSRAGECYNVNRTVSLDRSLPRESRSLAEQTEHSARWRKMTNPAPKESVVVRLRHEPSLTKSQRVDRHRHTSGQMYTNIPASQAGLCYADIVNQQAVGGHCSRSSGRNEENLVQSVLDGEARSTASPANAAAGEALRPRSGAKSTKKSVSLSQRLIQRSVSSGPAVVAHSAMNDHSAPQESGGWQEQTLTTRLSVCVGQLQERIVDNSVQGGSSTHHIPSPNKGGGSGVDIGAGGTEVGRFTVTCPTANEVVDMTTKVCTSSGTRRIWYTHSIDLSDSSTAIDPPASLPSDASTTDVLRPSESVSLVRQQPFTTPASPMRRKTSFDMGSMNLTASRRASHGDQPVDLMEFRNSEESAMTHTSLDSVRADRAQVLRDTGAPVAQWLMEYFDQIEKAKWTQQSVGSSSGAFGSRRLASDGGGGDEDSSDLDRRNLASYLPLSASTLDYFASVGTKYRFPKVARCNAAPASEEKRSHCKFSSSDHRQKADGAAEACGLGSRGSLVTTCRDDGNSVCLWKATMLGNINDSSFGGTRTSVSDDRPASQTATIGISSAADDGLDDLELSDETKLLNKELNALTYPSSQTQLDLTALSKATQPPPTPPLPSPAVHCTLATTVKFLRMRQKSRQKCGLISTAVIRGSRDTCMYSSSVPDLVQLLETLNVDRQEQQPSPPEDSNEMLVPSAPCVPEIYPLETLHNAMTLCQLEDFLSRLTIQKFPSPFTSPGAPSTPVNSTGLETVTCSNGGGGGAIYVAPTTSSKLVTTTAHTEEASATEVAPITKSDSAFVDGASQHLSQFTAAQPTADGAETSEASHPNTLPTTTIASITANTTGI
nr:unnamed protein product [Spirometra erinaceieuropaei]